MKKPKETSKQPLLPFTFLFFLILIVLIPNLYYSKAMDQQLEIRMLGLSVFLGILLLPLILIKKNALLRLADLKILKNPVVIIYAVFICIIGISVFWATNQSEAMYEFLKRVLFFILFLYLLLYILPKEESRLALIKAFVLFAISITITGIFQLLKVFTETKYNMEAIYLITGNFAQKNIFSEVLFIAFAFSIYGIAILDKIWKRQPLQQVCCVFYSSLF